MVDRANFARIVGVNYYLPKGELTNADLSEQFPEWTVEKIAKKTGISSRHIADETEFASDLAIASAEALLLSLDMNAEDIDFLIVCTQSPDFYMPITAGIVHDRLGLSTRVGATDINLGCSGFVYGLGLAKGLIESGQAANILLITTDTYSKFLNTEDKSVRTIFGDGAASTLISGDGDTESLAGFTYGTDGSGGGYLVVPNGGLRPGATLNEESSAAARGLKSSGFDLYMNGSEIFNFTLRVVPESVEKILDKTDMDLEDVDLFIFHQANRFMLEHLRNKLGIEQSKFFVCMETSGNTVSSTIPIALSEAQKSGVLQDGMKVMLLGFGVGLSWGGLMLTWSSAPLQE
jgi:3-oxoacyl-[acyl-carrier-protein] synthase-3